MKHVVRNVLFVLILCLTATLVNGQSTGPATTAPSVHSRVHIASSASDYWLAVTRPTDKPDAPAASVVYVREQGAERFSVVARLQGRIDAMTRWSGRAVVLLEDGQWLGLWLGNSSNGAPLPGNARIITLAGDEDSLWAIGAVPGGLRAALASTRPTTRSTTTPTTTTTSNGGLDSTPVLFKLQGSDWQPWLELPVADAVLTPGAISLITSGDRVAAAIQTTSGQPTLITTGFVPNVTNELPFNRQATIQLFKGLRGEMLSLVRTQRDGALVETIATVDPTSGDSLIDLPKGVLPPRDPFAIGAAFGYLRIVSLNDQINEQRLSADGNPVGSPEPIDAMRAADEVPGWSNYFQGTVVAMLIVAIFASMRNRDATREALARRDRPRPARVWIRLSAAAVDALPWLVGLTFAYLRVQTKPQDSLLFALGLMPEQLIGVGVYLLHTTISELVTGRTIGKKLFGLRVVNLTGERPAVGAILIRNAMRIIDIALLYPFLLPILLLLFTPLRQRAGDAAAGTMVVDVAAPRMTDEIETPE